MLGEPRIRPVNDVLKLSDGFRLPLTTGTKLSGASEPSVERRKAVRKRE